MTASFSKANGPKSAASTSLPIHRQVLIARVALALVIAAAAALKLSLLWRAVGFEQGDPLEYINIAHAIAHQTGEEWWDIRPLLYPLLLVPLIWLGERLPDPSGEAAIKLLRAAPLISSLGCLAITAAIAGALSGRLAAVAATAILATSPIFNQLSVSPFAEIPSTLGILCAALIAVQSRSSLAGGMCIGVALGLACMVRYQSLAFIAPFAVWLMLGHHRARLGGFVAGLLLCVALQALLDLFAYGAPFHSLVQSAAYNVTTDEAASFYGAEPFSWYLESVGEWLGYPATALAVLGILGAASSRMRWEWGLILGLGVTMLLWLSAIAHKESRFTAQVTPFLAIAAGHGASVIAHMLPRIGGLVVTAVIALIAGAGMWQSAALPVVFNPGFVEGPKRVAVERPGAVLGTIPWFIARPYTYNRIQLVRADVDRWDDRDYMTSVLERADYLLLREYDFATDRFIQRLVDSQYRTLETYPEQVILLEKRRPNAPRSR